MSDIKNTGSAYAARISSIVKEMTAREFLKLVTSRSGVIKHSQVMIPRIGSGGKLKFRVEFEHGNSR